MEVQLSTPISETAYFSPSKSQNRAAVPPCPSRPWFSATLAFQLSKTASTAALPSTSKAQHPFSLRVAFFLPNLMRLEP